MEPKIVSREFIKPSYPTPAHLRIFKLSLFDKLAPPVYIPLVLFYQANDNISGPYDQNDIPKRIESLKKSLSDTLTRFYPLAAKIKDDVTIDCNDEGAYFVEARVDSSLRQYLTQPDLLLLSKLLPCEFNFTQAVPEGAHMTNIQVNVFNCGGIAIGLCVSHKIIDGNSLGTFVKSWAAAARGCEEPIRPNFDAFSLFPQNENDLQLRDASMVTSGSFLTKGKSVTKRFVFNSSAISTLRAQSTSPSVQNPTRVEAVSVFLCQCFMAASKEKNGALKPTLLTHAVNLRRKTTPFFPDNSIGNLLWTMAVKAEAGLAEAGDLVSLVRDSLSKILYADFLNSMRVDKGKCLSLMLKYLQERGELLSKEEVDHIGFSSWCKLGFYEADFGWGKPIWVSTIGLSSPVFMNFVVLMDTRLGDGIEAWVNLDQHDMAILERNPRLLNLAQVNPSPF